MTQTFYKGSHGIILVYDCTSEESFKNVSYWMTQIDSHATKGVARMLVGNKCDMDSKVITTEMG